MKVHVAILHHACKHGKDIENLSVLLHTNGFRHSRTKEYAQRFCMVCVF